MNAGSTQAEHPDTERVRAAELVATLCLATDLGMGFPLEHGLQTTVIASRLAERLDVDTATASEAYYGSLLAHSGCTTADAHTNAEIFGGSLTTHMHPFRYGSRRELVSGIARALPDPEATGATRALQIARRMPRAARAQRPHLTAMCEVAQLLAQEFELRDGTRDALAHLTERWDGKGPLARARGEGIPLAMRIVAVAADAAMHRMLGGPEQAVRIIGERAGTAFDPAVARCVTQDGAEILAFDEESVWEETLACEPHPQRVLAGAEIDRALTAMAGFADLMSPYLSGHSAGVAALAAAAAEVSGLSGADVTGLRRAGFLHDLGRVAVGAEIWQKPGALNPDEWEQVRLHPYQTERVLVRSGFLAGMAAVAAAHHERCDGSGYHRGVPAAELPIAARLLAAADSYHAMTEPRPHRAAREPGAAAAELGRDGDRGKLDAGAVTAVIEATGQQAPPVQRPAGLTERETQVVAMLARGLQTKQIARGLGISAKTADRHIQNAYGKIGVSTRAAATVFAMQHGLLAWGELPIAAPAASS